MVKLRDHTTTEDTRLDRLVQFDQRSLGFPIRSLLEPRPKARSYTWALAPTDVLDQGAEGACVGFAWTHELLAAPVTLKAMGNAWALNLYREAQRLDEWEGEQYSGTSVLAGAKALQRRGFLGEYRWAFGLEEVAFTIGNRGPVVLGINWYESMYSTSDHKTLRGHARVQVSGAVVGGHAILARAVSWAREEVLLQNSWGRDWGVDGAAWLSFEDLARLLGENGEACVPVMREQGL